jgi:UDP-glucose 4-epimerase
MNIAVIGSNGFIGRHLVRALGKLSQHRLFLFGKSKVSCLDEKYPYVQIELGNPALITENFRNIDVVYYLASESIPATTWNDPIIEIEMNLIPFIKFNECISKLGVRKIAFVSSAGTVYGPSDNKVNEQSDKNPFSPYGITKLSMEHYLNYFRVKHGLQSDVFRISNVYGAGQDTSKGLGIINTFLEKIATEGEITVFGDGENIRNYIYIDDVAELLTLTLSLPLDKSEVFNLSSNDTLSINELVKIVRKSVAEEFRVKYIETRGSDNSGIFLDNSKILSRIPAFKLTPLEEGIRRTYAHIKEQLIKKL